MRIDEALQKYVVQLRADGRSVHTIGQYRRHVRLFAAWWGDRADISSIDHEDLAAFLASPEANERPDGGRKKATSTNALRTSLRCFFAYAHAAGWVSSNPARLIRRARCGPQPPHGLSKAVQERLFAALAEGKGEEADRDAVMFRLMLTLGLRVGEVVGLDTGDVDITGARIWIRKAKGDRPDRMPLPLEMVQVLTGYLDGRGSGPLFVSRKGGRLTTRQVARRLQGWLELAGAPRAASPHGLRHAFAMALYRKTGDLALVQRGLRHRSIASTTIYARADEDRLRAAMGG